MFRISRFKIPTAVILYCFLFEKIEHTHYKRITHIFTHRKISIFIWQTKKKQFEIFLLVLFSHFCLFNMQAGWYALSFAVVFINFFTCFLMEMCNMCYEITNQNACWIKYKNTCATNYFIERKVSDCKDENIRIWFQFFRVVSREISNGNFTEAMRKKLGRIT